ncbi:hypothetical protein LTR17_013805 [Elasticomyces elasticus]|nr:hypothetical protein LTR17_013805 [Elasticomyces elasticus]
MPEERGLGHYTATAGKKPSMLSSSFQIASSTSTHPSVAQVVELRPSSLFACQKAKDNVIWRFRTAEGDLSAKFAEHVLAAVPKPDDMLKRSQLEMQSHVRLNQLIRYIEDGPDPGHSKESDTIALWWTMKKICRSGVCEKWILESAGGEVKGLSGFEEPNKGGSIVR